MAGTIDLGTTGKQRIEHEFAYAKGIGPVDDEQVVSDALAQQHVFARDLGGATFVSVERVGEKSNGGFYTFKATYDVPLRESRAEDYAYGGPKGRVLVPIENDQPAFAPFVPEGGYAPVGQAVDHPNTVVMEADMPQQPTQEAKTGEPVSDLGHTEEQVRQIRETGKVPDPTGKPDPNYAPSTAVSTGDTVVDLGTATTTTTAAPKRKSPAKAAATTTTARPE